VSALIRSLLVALAACTPSAPDRAIARPPRLASLRLRAPSVPALGYDAVGDQWIVATATERALVTPAVMSTVAGPDAFVHAVAPGARIETRESLPDGFAVTFRRGTARETYVVKELGRVWTVCTGSTTLCKSLRRL